MTEAAIKRPLAVLIPLCGVLSACSADQSGEESACTGILLSASEDREAGSGSFTISELMAHSAAMGMTQEEAQTLLYLEGISPSHRLAPGETLCVDGEPE